MYMHIEICDKIRGFLLHVAFHLCSLSTLATCGQIILHMQIEIQLTSGHVLNMCWVRPTANHQIIT